MAQSAAQVDSLLVQLQQVGREADLVLSSLDALTVTADQRKRFNDLKELSANCIAALSDIGAKRIAILSLFMHCNKLSVIRSPRWRAAEAEAALRGRAPLRS